MLIKRKCALKDSISLQKVLYSKSGTNCLGTINFKQFGESISPGNHEIELEMIEGSTIPFSCESNFYVTALQQGLQSTLNIEGFMQIFYLPTLNSITKIKYNNIMQ